MTASWTAEDGRIATQLQLGLGLIRVISHEENRMTDVIDASASEDTGWEPEDGAPSGGVTYPEYPYSLADHVYTWSPKLPDGSMLVVRASTAEALAEAAEAVASVTGRLRAAWDRATRAPQNAFTPPPFGPNVSAPQAPGYQGPPAPQAPQWGGAPQGQPQQQWGGQQRPAQGQRQEYPAPQGWYKLNVPFPGGKDQLHALAQSLGIPKGNPAKGGMYNFFGLNSAGQPAKAWYCDPNPNVLQALSQFNPMVA